MVIKIEILNPCEIQTRGECSRLRSLSVPWKGSASSSPSSCSSALPSSPPSSSFFRSRQRWKKWEIREIYLCYFFQLVLIYTSASSTCGISTGTMNTSSISTISNKMWYHRWNFITMANKAESVVTKRLREEEPSLPFFS